MASVMLRLFKLMDAAPLDTGPYRELFLRAALLGSVEVCANVIDRMRRRNLSAEEIVSTLIHPTLTTVGELWEKHEIGVGQEHLATAVCERAVEYLFPVVVRGLDGTRRVLLLPAPGNRHALGIRILSHVLESHRYYVDFLGSETPAEEVVSFARITRPRVVGLSLSISDQIPATRDVINRLRNALPGVRILAGGSAKHEDLGSATGADAAPANVAETLMVLEQWFTPHFGPISETVLPSLAR